MDPEFVKLSENDKTSYISNILLPEALILVNMSECEITRKLAINFLKESDIVDVVRNLRNKKPGLLR